MGYVLRGTVMQDSVRVFAAITTDIVEKARQIHDMSPTASAALGRFLTAGAIIGTMLKNDTDTMTLSINGKGPAGSMIVVSNAKGSVKGYIANPNVDLPLANGQKLDVGGAVGKDGMLSITMDLGLKDPYVGQVPIYTGEIGDDIAYYYTVSEQTPSAVVVGVLVNTDLSILGAGGLIIQMMPGANEFVADIIENRLHEIPPLSTLVSEGKSAEEILNMLFDDMDLKIYERKEINYICDCSRERVEHALAAIGREDLEKLREEEEEIEMQCHFCNSKYYFTRADITKILEK